MDATDIFGIQSMKVHNKKLIQNTEAYYQTKVWEVEREKMENQPAEGEEPQDQWSEFDPSKEKPDLKVISG